MLHKDLLQLVFQELDHGHDMLNFSEISHRCNQIFHQEIKVSSSVHMSSTRKYMTNRHQQYHGISKAWHWNGLLWYDMNLCHNQRHGISRVWLSNESIVCHKKYYHGRQIEKLNN